MTIIVMFPLSVSLINLSKSLTNPVMSRSYPMWIDVESCLYKSSKSYGVKDMSTQVVNVGSSPRNSHPLGVVRYSRRKLDDGTESFAIIVDGVVVKQGIFDGNELKIVKEVHQTLATVEEKHFHPAL